MAFPPINSSDDAVKVPAPPPVVAEEGITMAEVTIRTLSSDLKSLGIMGGAGAIGENFTVALGGKASTPENKSPRSWGMWALITAAGLAFLFLFGYYFIPAVLESLR